MFTNSNVKLANDDVCSSRSKGATRALAEGNGASEIASPRPHAPRSAKPKGSALTGLHSDICSASVLRSATQRSRISDCAPAGPRLLDGIRASFRRRIGRSPTDQVSQTHSPSRSRVCTSQLSHQLPASSTDPDCKRQLAANCRPKPTQLRSKTRADCAQTKSVSGPIPRPVHRIALTTLQPAPAMTRSEAPYRDRKRQQRSSNQPQ
jgi:hypothetical protein